MEQATQTLSTPEMKPAGSFSMKIENTTYMVGVHFSRTAKDTLEDKMKRLMLDEVKITNFGGRDSGDVASK